MGICKWLHSYTFNNENACEVTIVKITKNWNSMGGVLEKISLGISQSSKDSGSVSYILPKKMKISPYSSLGPLNLFNIYTKPNTNPGSVTTSVSFEVEGNCKTTAGSSVTSYIRGK